MSEFYFAKVNDDGTYGELQKWKGLAHIEPITEAPAPIQEKIIGDCSGSVTIECEIPQKLENQLLLIRAYIYRSQKKSCLTCRKCKEMYRYPGFVTAEECVCTDGLECDTIMDRVQNCPNYEHREFGEPMQRNPDLDKYPYVIR